VNNTKVSTNLTSYSSDQCYGSGTLKLQDLRISTIKWLIWCALLKFRVDHVWSWVLIDS